MSRANPSSDLSTRAASPLGLSRLQPGQKVMGIELQLSRAPGFVISKGPGRFQALSVHAMSWHLTHKVALVLAYLQAADSNCQQRGENEWSGTAAEIILLLLGKHSIPYCWGVLSLLTLDIKIFATESLGGWVHAAFFSTLSPSLQWPQGNTKNLMNVRPRLCVNPRNTAMTDSKHHWKQGVSHFPHAICLFFQKLSILWCADISCIFYSEWRHRKPIAPDSTPSHNPQFDLNTLQPEAGAWR